jgi:hypothetical protein
MKQRILNEVALSLSRKIRNRGKQDPQTFQAACETFVKVMEMMDQEQPPEDKLRQLRSDLNRVMTVTGIQ